MTRRAVCDNETCDEMTHVGNARSMWFKAEAPFVGSEMEFCSSDCLAAWAEAYEDDDE